MAKAKKYTYRIQYINDTYQMVEWTRAELQSLVTAMNDDVKGVLIAEDVFRVSDIRAVTYFPPAPEPTKEEKRAEAEQQLSEWGFVDADTAQWLKDNGIDLGGGH